MTFCKLGGVFNISFPRQKEDVIKRTFNVDMVISVGSHVGFHMLACK